MGRLSTDAQPLVKISLSYSPSLAVNAPSPSAGATIAASSSIPIEVEPAHLRRHHDGGAAQPEEVEEVEGSPVSLGASVKFVSFAGFVSFPPFTSAHASASGAAFQSL